MKTVFAAALASLLLGGTSALAQQAAAPAAPQPFVAGTPLGVTAEGKFNPMSSNVKVYGAIVSAESCSYDPARNLIMAVNRGGTQKEAPNDGFVSLINHDGSVHTSRWIGATRNGLVLNQPFGSVVHDGKLYLADSDGDTADGAKRVSVIRMFDLKTGAPAGEIASPDVAWLNDIAVAKDGTIYGSQTGSADAQTPWRIYRIAPDGKTSIFIEGAPLSRPNGVAIDKDGNIVVVNIGDDSVLTFSPAATLIRTEKAAQPGNDGLVIMPDGTKYVSSVVNGGVSRIRPGQPAQLIATGIPSAASMCLDAGANQLVIPMNANNSLAFVKL
jgi:DNA-binding beta-propeller fold protein YncE